MCFWKYNNERGRGSVLPNHLLKKFCIFAEEVMCDDGKIHIVCDQQSKLKKRANGINIDWDITMLPYSHTQLTENKKGSVFAAVLHISVILKNFSGIFIWKYDNGRGKRKCMAKSSRHQ